jgi:hypothetical protein
MADEVTITLTTAGAATGPFNLYSNLDGYTTAFETGVSQASLVAGYLSILVPTGTTTIRVTSTGACTNSVDLPVTGITTTTTTTPIPSATVVFHGMKVSTGAHAMYAWYSINDITMTSPIQIGPAFTNSDVILGSIVLGSLSDTITVAVSDNSLGPNGVNYTFNSQYSSYPGSTSGNPCGTYMTYSPGTSAGIYILADGTSAGC